MPPNVQPRSNNALKKRSRLLEQRDATNRSAPVPAADIYTLAIRSRKLHAASSTYPVLLSSRPNPNSISQLLKERYRMARLRIVRGLQLPTPAAQRNKIEKKNEAFREGKIKRPGPKPKARTPPARAATAESEVRRGERESPIVIDADEGGERPEKAPICFVDESLAEAERMVTPDLEIVDLDSHDFGTGGGQSPFVQVEAPVGDTRETPLKRKTVWLAPAPLPDESRPPGTRAQTAPPYSFLGSDLNAIGTRRPRKRQRAEELPEDQRTLEHTFTNHQPSTDASSSIPHSSIMDASIEHKSSPGTDNAVAILNDLKTKVAQLMATAPGIPIGDLYNRLNEMDGDLSRVSETVQRYNSRSARGTPVAASVPEADTNIKQDGLDTDDENGNAAAVIDKAYANDEDILTKLEHKEFDFWADEVEDADMPYTTQPRKKRAVRKPKATTKGVSQEDCTTQGTIEEEYLVDCTPRPKTKKATKEISPFPWDKFSGYPGIRRSGENTSSCKTASTSIEHERRNSSVPREPTIPSALHHSAALSTPSNPPSSSTSYEPPSPSIPLSTSDSATSYEPPSADAFRSLITPAPTISSNTKPLPASHKSTTPSRLTTHVSPPSDSNTSSSFRPSTAVSTSDTTSTSTSLLTFSDSESGPDSDGDFEPDDREYMDHLRSGLRARARSRPGLRTG